jgi:GT2 family glycosyltransferase
VSVIVPAFNGWKLTEACLASLEGTDAEIVLVDNGSEDETCECTTPDIVVNVWPNRGFARACNVGAAVASGAVLVFLNNDTEVSDGWLDPILAPFDDERVGIVGCRLVYPNGQLQHAGVWFDSPGGVLTAHNLTAEDAPSRTVEAVTGACMAVRASTFRDLGGFDTGYYNGYEDVDLCLAARRDGWRIWYTADSTIVHHESQSGPSRWAAVRQNVARLQERWAS